MNSANIPCQITSNLIMIFPRDFTFNEQTSGDNEFMIKKEFSINQVFIEFNESVKAIKVAGIHVSVFDKNEFGSLNSIITPDSVFPNNWLSTTSNGKLVIFPMLAPNRQLETKSLPFIEEILKMENFKIDEKVFLEKKNDEDVLEGTGSLILDHVNKVAYASLSKRTSENQVLEFCYIFDFKPIIFRAKSSKGMEFYHTNILLSIGEGFAVLCEESIFDEEERLIVKEELQKNHQIIPISMEQAEKYFCGNILHVKNENGNKFIIMSNRAFEGFTENQIKELKKFGEFILLPILLIEEIGGGSARCMICENFLEKNK